MPPDIFDLILPLLAVIIVIAAAWLFTRLLARRHAALSSGRNIKVVERVSTGKDSSLVIVRVGGRAFLLSVAGQNSSLITELDPDTLLTDSGGAPGGDFLGALASAIKNISKSGGNKNQ